MSLFSKAGNRIRYSWQDRKGSEAAAFISTLALSLLVVVSLLSVLAYAYRVNELNYANRRAVRSIEVTGIYDQAETQALVKDLLPHMTSITVTVRDEDGNVLTGANNKIQLRDTFSVALESTYTLQFFSAFDRGNIEIPIASSTQGMSEVYWK